MDKLVSYQDFVDQLSDGMTIGVGGWGCSEKTDVIDQRNMQIRDQEFNCR